MKPKIVVLFLLAFNHSIPTYAHDLWLLPDGKAIIGKKYSIRVNSGEEFPKSKQAPDTSKFVRSGVIGPDGTRIELVSSGKDGDSGMMSFLPSKPGTHIISVQTVPRLITLNPESFNNYLVSDGLSHIYRMRYQEKSLNQPGKERYTKSPKLILKIGGEGGDPTKVVGLPLEIIPLKDPTVLKINDTLRVRVLFKDLALSDAQLGWTHPDMGETSVGTVRTNAKGEALIPIAQSGLMTIRLTHMTRPKTDDYEWESYWTTLTFQID